MQIYLVGGAVRDQLLGLEVKERDWVVVGATPQQMLDQGFKPVGKDFPVFIHPQTGEEYALARTERKSGKGYYGFTCYAAPDVTLEDDLRRRDLTINAIAQTESGEIIDPYGGQNDLQRKLLKHVSTAFREDPLRVLRTARFATRFATQGFTIEHETEELMREMVRSGELNSLQAERVWQEVDRSLGEDQPFIFFQVLRQCGALKILFPEIDCLFGVPNPPQWHPEIDSGIHTLMALQQATAMTSNRAVRFATLVHDLGKGLTPKTIWPRHTDHSERGIAVIEKFCERYRVPKHYRELAILVSRYHILCHRCLEINEKTLLNFLEHADVFRRPQRFAEFLQVCCADFFGRGPIEEKEYPQKIFLEKIVQQLLTVNTQELTSLGLTGLKFKDALHKKRLGVVRRVMKDWQISY